jgi:hypothetical protein
MRAVDEPDLALRETAGAASEAPRVVPTTTVIVCAYTAQRWDLLIRAVRSLRTQTVPPSEVVVCIDHNDELLRRARA